MMAAPHDYQHLQFLRSRSEVADHCLDFFTWLDKNAAQKVKRMRTDSAPEFVGFQNKDWPEMTSSLQLPSSLLMIQWTSEDDNQNIAEKIHVMIKLEVIGY